MVSTDNPHDTESATDQQPGTAETPAEAAPGSGEAAEPHRRVRLEVESFATTVYILDGDRRTHRGNVVWTERTGGTCIAAADDRLGQLGYRRVTDWTDQTNRHPTHTVGTRNGWYYTTVTEQEPAQP